MQAEREDRTEVGMFPDPVMQEYGDVNNALAQAVGTSAQAAGNLNLNDVIANDGLNAEIKKLLAEQNT